MAGEGEKSDVRRLQVTGGSTFILSLPKEWVDARGLHKGSQIALVRQKDDSLLVIPQQLRKVQQPTEAAIEIDASEAPEGVVRKIISMYLFGYGVIYVREKNQKLNTQQRNAIKDFMRRTLVGTEIIADSHTGLVIQVLLSYPELSVQNALRRMAAIASSMHEETMIALKQLDKESAQQIMIIDDEVDRFGLYIVRQLKSAVEDEKVLRDIGLSSGRECLGYRLITKFVERAADHAVEIGKNIVLLKHPLAPELLQKVQSMSLEAISVFNRAVDSLFSHNFKLAEQIVEKAKQVASLKKELLKSIFAETHPEEVSGLTLITESISRAAEYASDIAEIVLNLNVEQIIAANK